jgi:hypothetical protein
LLVGFVLVCLAEVVVGMMLLLDVPHAATVSYLQQPAPRDRSDAVFGHGVLRRASSARWS